MGPELSYITDEPGGNPYSRVSRAMAGDFAGRGLRFDSVYLRGASPAAGSRLDREIDLGGMRAAYSTPALARYLRSARPRAALVSSGQMGPSAVLAGRLAGIPVIPWEGTFVDLDLPEATRRVAVMARLQKLTYPAAPLIFAKSGDMVDWVLRSRRVDSSRVHLVPNPVDAAEIVEAGGSEGPDPDEPFRMCAVGRLVDQKGYDTLIAALGQVRDRLPTGWTLAILGEEGVWRGGWRARIEAMVADLGLGENVRLAGYRDNPHRDMKRSHLFVHAARWEPFGTVLVEALALGVPVVATACPGGPREILDGGVYGRLVPPDTPEALGEAILEMARQPEVRQEFARLGPARAEAYRPAAIAERIEEILDEAGI